MRILVTTSTLPARPGDGTPRFVADLAKALSEKAEVAIVAPGAPSAPSQERWGAVAVRRFTYFRPKRLQRLTPGIVDNVAQSFLAKAQLPGFVGAALVATIRELRRFKPDVVNAHWMVPQGLIAAVCKLRSAPWKLVLHAHAGDVDLLARLPLGRTVARFVASRSDAIFTDSAQVRDRLDRLLGRASEALPRSMGVDLDRFSAADPLPSPYRGGYVLYVGRLAAKKGVRYLVEAAARWRRRHPDVGLVIIGTGPEEVPLRAEVERLGLRGHVRFMGPQSHDVVASALHGCRVLAVPSIVDERGETEGLPTVIIEGMASGARVVASDVAGAAEIVEDGVNGWLCQPADSDSLAGVIDAVLATPDTTSIAQHAIATARGYSWESVANDYWAAIARSALP